MIGLNTTDFGLKEFGDSEIKKKICHKNSLIIYTFRADQKLYVILRWSVPLIYCSFQHILSQGFH